MLISSVSSLQSVLSGGARAGVAKEGLTPSLCGVLAAVWPQLLDCGEGGESGEVEAKWDLQIEILQ